jgi:hypothetical protein
MVDILDIIVRRVGVPVNPKIATKARVYTPCELRVSIELDRQQIQRGWVINCRTLAAVRYLQSELNKLMRGLDGVILIPAPEDSGGNPCAGESLNSPDCK